MTAPYGETFSLDEVRRKLTPEIRCVYVQATESSTGARHDVEAIAKLVRALPEHVCLSLTRSPGLGTTRLDVGRLGNRRHHWRLAEGADDPARIGLWRYQRAGVAAHGDGEVSAVLLRSAEGTKIGGQGGDGLHARDLSVCRTGRGARLRASNGRREPRGGARCADRERGVVCGDDARRRRSAGTEVIRAAVLRRPR